MTKRHPNNKHLIIEIHEEMHKALKQNALYRNITLRQYVLQILAKELIEEENRNK